MLAVIGGTGLGDLGGLEDVDAVQADTPWGSARVERGSLMGEPVLFLPRHGKPANTPPHEINYRANVFALAELGASRIVSVNAVGGIAPSLRLPEIVIPDQIIDYTWGRAQTFFDDDIRHIDFTFPYDAGLGTSLVETIESLNRDRDTPMSFTRGGVYGCTQGPRLETAAEIQRMARDGCDIVGMTAMPEAALARERELPYAGLCVVVNKAAGLDGDIVDLAGIEAVMDEGMSWVREVVRGLVTR